MKYDLRADSFAFHRPVHWFPGDESISPEAYASSIFTGYVSTVSTLTGVAEGFGMTVDAPTFERWKRMGAAAGLLDDYLDEAPSPKEAEVRYRGGLEDVVATGELPADVSGVSSELVTAVRLLHHATVGLPEARRSRLSRSARLIGSIAVDKAACTDVRDYIHMLKAEGTASAGLASDVASDQMQDHVRFKDFENWCEAALQGGTLLDHARDLWSDHREGRTSVRPTPAHALTIARAAIGPLRSTYLEIPARRATVDGLLARLHFSPLPTDVAMRRARRSFQGVHEVTDLSSE